MCKSGEMKLLTSKWAFSDYFSLLVTIDITKLLQAANYWDFPAPMDYIARILRKNELLFH